MWKTAYVLFALMLLSVSFAFSGFTTNNDVDFNLTISNQDVASLSILNRYDDVSNTIMDCKVFSCSLRYKVIPKVNVILNAGKLSGKFSNKAKNSTAVYEGYVISWMESGILKTSTSGLVSLIAGREYNFTLKYSRKDLHPVDLVMSLMDQELIQHAWYSTDFACKFPLYQNISTTSTDFVQFATLPYNACFQTDYDDCAIINASENAELNATIVSKTDGVSAEFAIHGNWTAGTNILIAYAYCGNATMSLQTTTMDNVFAQKTIEIGSTASQDNIPNTDYIFGSDATITGSSGFIPYKLKSLGMNQQAQGLATYVQFGLYNTTASSPNVLVGASNYILTTAGVHWVLPDANASYMPIPVLANNTEYYVGIVGDNYIFVYVNNAAGTSYYKNNGASGLPNPIASPSSFTRTYNARVIFYEHKWLLTTPTAYFGGVELPSVYFNVSAISPPDYGWINSTAFVFHGIVSGNKDSYNCTLYINGTSSGTASFPNGVMTSITQTSTFASNSVGLQWNITCSNGTATNSTANRTLFVDAGTAGGDEITYNYGEDPLMCDIPAYVPTSAATALITCRPIDNSTGLPMTGQTINCQANNVSLAATLQAVSSMTERTGRIYTWAFTMSNLAYGDCAWINCTTSINGLLDGWGGLLCRERSVISTLTTGDIPTLEGIGSAVWSNSNRSTSNLTAAEVWAATTRTLTDSNLTGIPASVWAYASRTLTNYNESYIASLISIPAPDLVAIASAVWSNSNRSTSNLTASEVWSYITRTLTTTEFLTALEREQLLNASNMSNVNVSGYSNITAADVWNYGTRSANASNLPADYLSVLEQEQLSNASQATLILTNGSINFTCGYNETELMMQVNNSINETYTTAATETIETSTDLVFMVVYVILSIALAGIALIYNRTILSFIAGAMWVGLGLLMLPMSLILTICCVGIGLYLWIRIFMS